MPLQAVRLVCGSLWATCGSKLCLPWHKITKCIKRENMKPSEGKHETLPHEGSPPRCLCHGGATHGPGLVQKMHTWEAEMHEIPIIRSHWRPAYSTLRSCAVLNTGCHMFCSDSNSYAQLQSAVDTSGVHGSEQKCKKHA
jgi:hypothetical protein